MKQKICRASVEEFSSLLLPTRIFRHKTTIFESVVFFLKEERHINFHQIGILLNRDERNIWSVYHRAKKKIGR